MSFSPGPSAQDDDIDGIAETLDSLDARSVSFRISAQGSRWEPFEALRPDGPPLRPSDFDVVAVHELARDRMRLSWQRTILEPLTGSVDYDEIVVGDEGYITGADVALAARPARPMTSDRLAAVRRQQQLLNPQLLVGEALLRQRYTGQQHVRYVGRQELDGAPHWVLEIVAMPRPIRLFVAVDSNEVSRLVTEENDYPYGDVEIVVVFSDWRRRNGLALPYQVELNWEGKLIHRETRQRIEVNPRLDHDTFVLPETHAYDPEVAERGLINEQWIHRGLAMGVPISLDAGEVVSVPITPDVVTLGGGLHHSLAIALDSGVVVVDPPQHEDRSLAVIEAVTARWPDKPITHLILTHHHYDHSGGIRAYAAIGAELIVAQGDRNFVTHCLARPHTIHPDTLAATTTRPAIRTVADSSLSLGGGAIEIYRISSSHSAEILIVYVRRAKLLFNADLFNPGLLPAGVPAPPYWLAYSQQFRRDVEALNLDIEVLLGAHGALEGRPFRSLVDFTQLIRGTSGMSSGLVLSKPTESLITHAPSQTPDEFTAGTRGTAAEAVIRTLIQHPSFGDGGGFHFLSGNAGSNEGPIWQAIQDVTGFKGLVHGATEFIATTMASGFEVLASAAADEGTKRIPVLVLHAQVGVKYGAAGLDFLVRQRQPCFLLIGDAGKLARRYGGHNSVPDYPGLLKELGVKSVHFPVQEEGPRGLGSAVQAAMTAVMSEPYGSVAVILDEDVLNTIVDIAPAQVATPPLKGTANSETPTAETAAAIVQAAELLMNKQRPVLVLNQEIGRSPGARKAAERLASLIAARVVACYAPGTIFDRGHPSWCGNLSFGEAEGVASQIASYTPDVVVVVGGPFPNNVWPNGRSEVPEGVPAIVISPDETDRTRCNIVAEVFVCANVGIALTRLAQQLDLRGGAMPTQEAPTGPRLVVTAPASMSGEVHPLVGQYLVIGRSERSPVRLDDEYVSREHAHLELTSGGYVLSDLRSTAGTTVNGALVETPRRLADGDVVGFGRLVEARFEDPRTWGETTLIYETRRARAQQLAANERLDQIAREYRGALESRIAEYEKYMDETPVHPARIAKELMVSLKTRAENGKLSLQNAAIFDEALTSSSPFLDYLEQLGLHDLFYYGTPGPTLGAHGASLGFQAATPNGLVISLFGDGGADFNEAAFIVAARENLAVKHLMIDNGGYELVSVNFARDARLRGENEAEQLAAGRVLPLHSQHQVHQNRAFQVRGFVSRATQEPVFESAYVELPEQVGPAIEAMLDSKGPFLLQIIAQGVHFQPANT